MIFFYDCQSRGAIGDAGNYNNAPIQIPRSDSVFDSVAIDDE